MTALRVAHVVESLEIGGIERIVAMLVRHMRNAFHIEVICTSRGGPIAEAIERDGTPVRVLGLPTYYPSGIAGLARTLREIRPDVVHSHGHFAGVLARGAGVWAGIPAVVHHLHTIDTTLRRRHRHLERLLATVTSRVVCCSGAVAEHARRDLRLPERITTIVPNGIDPPPEVDATAQREQLARPIPPLIGCIGGLARHKGQEVLIRALEPLARDLPEGTVLFVGEGKYREALESRARSVPPGWSVRFLGRRTDARSLLAATDIVAVPSIEREGFSLAALEAMDAAKPVVASRVGGLPEVVEDGVTGRLVDPDDPVALADAIRSIWTSPDRGQGMGAAGRRRVDSLYRGSMMARRITALYEETLHARRAA